MNQISQSAANASLLRSPAFLAAFFMILAGAFFALVNVTTQYLTMRLGLSSPVVVFGQYLVALILSLPWLMKVGLGAMKTAHPGLHSLRVLFAALGVQAWVAGLAHVPIWQAIALIMTSPFFVTLGAKLFLGETIGLHRVGATLVGFIGGMIILAPWSDAFTLHALWPVVAAIFWAATSVLTKQLTGKEAPETVTVYLLVLMTPINGILAWGGGFETPSGIMITLIIGSGLLTMLAQLLIAKAYAKADAAYVQPFDHLKLPLNVLGGWLAFGFAPPGQLWLGAALIVAASLYIIHREARSRP
ncbi:MAG: DMT family transporter [Cohaesibacter sp.]|jgi:S-adenosylmethionine uptake transporter|nr:DMT family transporter [Cohaesibacter sp.]